MAKLTDIKYWQSIQGSPCVDIDDNNIIKKWIENNVELKKIRNCVEIGCYPGRYLSIFGDYGIELNGIDYIPNISEIATLCKQKGYKTGYFHCVDFHQNTITNKFDCVYSLGFLEHFKDWAFVFKKHLDLVDSGGLVIIEVPNFRGWMQRLPRLLFDRENYLRHNIESMNINAWEKILEQHNFEIITADNIGGYMLWFEKKCNKPELILRRLFVFFLKIIKNVLYPLQKDHPAFSGAIGIIARKNN